MKKKFVKHRVFGFTLIELMVVVAIVALLGMIAVPSYKRFTAKAKRSEVYVTLGALYAAERAYWIEHGTYTNMLNGSQGLGWQAEGQPLYTYGFSGVEGINAITGKLKGPIKALDGTTHADQNTFVVAAVADIDGDGELDIITINEKRELVIVKDDIG
jgi:prepilin-type N-terminal cleavage/methylation domain-containing protein